MVVLFCCYIFIKKGRLVMKKERLSYFMVVVYFLMLRKFGGIFIKMKIWV